MLAVAESRGEAFATGPATFPTHELASVVGLPDQVAQEDAAAIQVALDAGGENRVWHKTFHGLEPNAGGLRVVSFVPIENYACINAFEVVDKSR